MSSAVTSRVDAVRVSDEHIAPLAAFYRRVWNPDATPESVRSGRAAAALTNVASPGEAPPTWIVLQDSQAIAHVTTIPIKLWLGGRERPAYWMKGLWVLPEVQRSSAGFLVLRAASSQLVEPSLALVHEPAAIRLFQALGYTDLGGLPNRLRVLRPTSVLRRIDGSSLPLGERRWMRVALSIARAAATVIGPLLAAVSATWSALHTGAIRGLAIDVIDQLDRDELDELWQMVRSELPAAPVRDGAQLVGRYAGAGYSYVRVRSGSRLVGIAIVKQPNERGDTRLGGIRIATVSDFLYPPNDRRVGLALLRGAERVAKGLGADALLCGASANTMNAALRKRGYLALPANLHVLARVPGAKEDIPSSFGDWWITRGDSEGDGTF